jgi:predicted negative regulator of RcsB-dependent stress response
VEDYLSEREQWEAIKSWLRENGLWILAGIAVGAAGLGGWRWWQDHVDQVALQAGGKYEQMRQAFGRGDHTQALVLLGELERNYSSSPYADQGKLTAARVYVDSGELDKAGKELQAVAQHSQDRDLALLARLRLARVQIAQQKPDDALATLNGIEPGAFAPRYHEVRGDAYYAKGDKATALKEYRTARAADLGGVSDTSLLDLKISDLLADAAPVASPEKAQAARAESAK